MLKAIYLVLFVLTKIQKVLFLGTEVGVCVYKYQYKYEIQGLLFVLYTPAHS